MEHIVFEKINGRTAGRDLLEWNKPSCNELNQVIRRMLNEIRNDKINEEYGFEEVGEIELFNTNGQAIGFTLELTDDHFKLAIGITPRYQHEKLLIIIIEKDKVKSRVITGIARGPYGSGIQSNEKHYSTYKYGKYKDYIDRWYPELIKTIKQAKKTG